MQPGAAHSLSAPLLKFGLHVWPLKLPHLGLYPLESTFEPELEEKFSSLASKIEAILLLGALDDPIHPFLDHSSPRPRPPNSQKLVEQTLSLLDFL